MLVACRQVQIELLTIRSEGTPKSRTRSVWPRTSSRRTGDKRTGFGRVGARAANTPRGVSSRYGLTTFLH